MPPAYERARYLSPSDVRFWRNDLDQLCARVAEDGDHVDVLVFRTRPITDPNRYVSLRVGARPSEQREIGIIRNLDALAPDQRRLVREELTKRYFIHLITRIRAIREELGFLYWTCDTDKGERQFALPRWDQRSVFRAAKGVWVITDTDGTRYEIPALKQLDAASRALFRRYIYW